MLPDLMTLKMAVARASKDALHNPTDPTAQRTLRALRQDLAVAKAKHAVQAAIDNCELDPDVHKRLADFVNA